MRGKIKYFILQSYGQRLHCQIRYNFLYIQKSNIVGTYYNMIPTSLYFPSDIPQ